MPRWPTGAFSTHRTGCYGCLRFTPSDGACGISGHPCTHWGVDLFADDSRVVAPDAGVVVAVSDGNSAPWRGYGPGVVVIRGDSGVFLLLGHLSPSSIAVSVGQRVAEGAPIGRFDAWIAHTHFEVRRELTGPSDTNTIDPGVWIGSWPRTLLIAAGLGIAAWWLTGKLSSAS